MELIQVNTKFYISRCRKDLPVPIPLTAVGIIGIVIRSSLCVDGKYQVGIAFIPQLLHGSAGELAVCAQTIAVTDADGDGALTITDALAAAHAAFYPQGVEGYATEMTDYGLSMQKLWGVENGGSYGYYVNNASAFNMTDPIADGDYVAAYSYADLEGWSDTYTWFDDLVVVPGEVTLTLSAAAFDESWNPVTLPVGTARILINGEATDFYTDDHGDVTLTVAAGDVISAAVDGMVIVPPVCVVVGQ